MMNDFGMSILRLPISVGRIGRMSRQCSLFLDISAKAGSLVNGAEGIFADRNQFQNNAVSINYLSAPKGDKLFAEATCRKSGRTSSIVIVNVSDDTGRDIAQFVGTGFKL